MNAAMEARHQRELAELRGRHTRERMEANRCRVCGQLVLLADRWEDGQEKPIHQDCREQEAA